MTTVYRGSFLHSLGPNETAFVAAGLLAVEGDGTIAWLRPERDVSRADLKGVRRVDLEERIVVPGLIDSHLHIPQIDMIGIESENLIDWLRDHIFEEEMANEDPAVARDRARRCFRQLLRAGTTACAAYSSVHTEATAIALEEAAGAGIRAIVGKVLMDREAPAPLLEPAGSALADTERLIREWSGAMGGRLDVAITPRFGISCSAELLAGAGALAAKTGARVQTHLSENKGELRAIGELFPDADDYTAVYEGTGLLRRGTLLAHCIHLSDDEMARIAQQRAAAVYCPDSNFFLHSGRFPLRAALDHGLDIALGSDVGAGTCFSLFEAMKMGNYMQVEQVDPALLFYFATLGGAHALGWGDRLGNFLPGKAADFVVLGTEELLRGRRREEWDHRELLSILIHRGHRATVERVHIAGERVL